MYCNRFSLILGSMYTAYLHIKMDYVFHCDDNEIELLATDTVLTCDKNLFLCQPVYEKINTYKWDYD